MVECFIGRVGVLIAQPVVVINIFMKKMILYNKNMVVLETCIRKSGLMILTDSFKLRFVKTNAH